MEADPVAQTQAIDSRTAAGLLANGSDSVSATGSTSALVKQVRTTTEYMWCRPQAFSPAPTQNSGIDSITLKAILESVTAMFSKILEPIFQAVNKLGESLNKLTTQNQDLQAKNEALTKKVEELESGKPANPTPTEGASGSSPLTNATGFLWKPVSAKDKKLAVLLPSRLADDVKKVRVLSKDGKELAVGKASGKDESGRPVFRFNKAGGQFADHAVVEIQLKSGGKRTFEIAETSKRLERK